MYQKTKKIISIAIISILILLIFFVLPLVFASAPFGSLTLEPDEGPSGTIVTITGTGFASGTYRVYFDKDNDERWDWGEPYKTVTASSGFKTTLTIPSVPSGLYYIRAGAFPYPYIAIASEEFTVKTIYDELLGIFDETYTGIMTHGYNVINITSTENFQVKAVYVSYYDPDDPPAYAEVTGLSLFQKNPFYYFFGIDHEDMEIHEETLPFGYELLSYMKIDLSPAGSGGDSILIGINNHGDGNEELYIKAIVESSKTAEITVSLVS
ncbi:MAG: hypothetical protein QXL52_05635 [Nitrososphaerales archaeon]